VTREGAGVITSAPAGITCGATCTGLFDQGPVILHASTDGAGTFFAGWDADGACGGPTHECPLTLDRSLTVRARFAARTANLVFVTTRKFPTTLGSAGAYDAGCNQVATQAGLNDPDGHGYVAMVSSPTSLARARLGAARGWVRLDGLPFADTVDNLFAPKSVIWNDVRYFETGADARDTFPMTGTAGDGTSTLDFSCDGWTTDKNGSASAGYPSGGPERWLAGNTNLCTPAEIICLGKSRTTTVAPVVTPGKRIWLSHDYHPGREVEAPDTICQRERAAGVLRAVAFLSTSRSPASDKIAEDATYVRPDGTLVARGSALLAGKLSSGVWQFGDGRYAAANSVWTGSTMPTATGTLGTTCGDWQNAGQGGISGIPGTNTWWWMIPGNGSGFTCGPAPLYCVEAM
jgi:hypothetical protein